MARDIDTVDIARAARENGFGVLVIGQYIALIRDREEVFHTSSWKRISDFLDGYKMGLEARK